MSESARDNKFLSSCLRIVLLLFIVDVKSLNIGGNPADYAEVFLDGDTLRL